MGIRSRGAGVPVGTEVAYHGGDIPPGWLLEYGQIVNIADYPALFLKLATRYGGDGVSTFGIPDSRGRATFGKDDMGGTPANRVTSGLSGVNGAALGAVGGGQTVTLTAAQMPSHAHSDYYERSSVGTSSYDATDGNMTANANYVTSFGNSGGWTTGGGAGSGGAHSNLPPAIVANKMIKY